MNKSSGTWEKTSVEAMESGVVSIGAMDNTGNVDTFEVSGMPDHDCLFHVMYLFITSDCVFSTLDALHLCKYRCSFHSGRMSV